MHRRARSAVLCPPRLSFLHPRRGRRPVKQPRRARLPVKQPRRARRPVKQPRRARLPVKQARRARLPVGQARRPLRQPRRACLPVGQARSAGTFPATFARSLPKQYSIEQQPFWGSCQASFQAAAGTVESGSASRTRPPHAHHRFPSFPDADQREGPTS